MKWFEYAIAITACVLLAAATPLAAWTINGSCVYEENAYYKIEQCPHTLQDFTNYPVLSVTNKDSNSHTIDIAFGFDTPDIRPTQAWLWNANAPHEVPTYGNVSTTYTCDEPNVFSYQVTPYKYFWCNTTQGAVVMNHSFLYGYVANKSASWNEWGQNGTTIVYYADWVDVSGAFQSVEWRGKTWFYKSNINFAASETKVLKAKVNVQPNTQGKYDLFAKLSSDTFQEAFDENRFTWLDPWFNTSWSKRKPITLMESYATQRGQEPVSNVTGSGGLNITGLTLATNNCRQELRIVANYSTPTSIDIDILNNTGQTEAAGNQWCQIQFLVNGSTSLNATYVKFNETNYWAYYNNPTAPNVTVNKLYGWSYRTDGQAPLNTEGWTNVSSQTNVMNYSYNKTGNSIMTVNDSGATGYALWAQVATASNDGWTYEVRTHHLFDSSDAFLSSAYGFSRVTGNDAFIGVKIGAVRITDLGDGDIYNEKSVTTTDNFHVYRLIFLDSANTYSLYMDGAKILTGTNGSSAGTSSYVTLGENWYTGSYTFKDDIDYVYAATAGIFPPLTAMIGVEEDYTSETYFNTMESSNSTAYETTQQYYYLNVTFNDGVFKNVTANLTWNGTTYNYTNATGTNNTNFTTSITIPLIDTNDTKALMQWNYTFTYLNGTTYARNTTETNQSIYLATYFINITASPNPAITEDTITITSYLANLANAGYTVTHYVNSTNTSAPYTAGGAWLSTFTAPTTNATEIVNGTVNVTFGGVSKYRNSTSYTVNVTGFELILCPGILIYNFSTIDEDTLLPINGSQYMTFTVWNNDRTRSRQFNFTFDNVTYAEICASVNGTALVDSFQIYNATGYGQRAYFLYNATLNTTEPSQNITLYGQTVPPSKGFRITVKDANDVTVKNAYISALRWYPGTNTYLTVAMIITDDNGQGYTYLQPNDVWYYFIQNKAGTITEFTSRQAVCDPVYSLCELTLKALPTNTSGSAYLNMIGSIQASCTDNNATNYTSCTFIDTSGYYHHYTMKVVKQGVMANTVVCNTTIYTSTGTISCLVNQQGYYAVSLTAGGSPAGWLAGMNYYRGVQQSLFGAAGLSSASGAFLALPIVITIVLGAVTAPATGLIFGVFAIILMGVIGLIVVSPATAAVLIIFAIMVAWKLKV